MPFQIVPIQNTPAEVPGNKKGSSDKSEEPSKYIAYLSAALILTYLSPGIPGLNVAPSSRNAKGC